MSDKIITHVIFDMDGLILNTEPLYEKTISKVLGSFGHEYTLDLKNEISGRPGLEGAKLIVDKLSLPITYQAYNEILNKEYQNAFAEFIPFMPGAEKLIKHLHSKQIPIALATSSARFTFEMKTKPHKEIFSLFDPIVIASDDPEISKGKPDPQPFLVAASRFKNPPKDMSNVIVFEDSINGVQAANAAGMKSIWVPDHRVSKKSITAALILDSLEDFKPEDFGLPPFDQ